MQLCDTNILSELTRPKPDPGALAWAKSMSSIALSAVTLDEIRYGLSWRPKPRVTAWFEGFLQKRCEILPVTAEIADVSGELRGHFQKQGETRSQADMMIAATAKVHGLTLVTRNVRHFENCGISVLNPMTDEST